MMKRHPQAVSSGLDRSLWWLIAMSFCEKTCFLEVIRTFTTLPAIGSKNINKFTEHISEWKVGGMETV